MLLLTRLHVRMERVRNLQRGLNKKEKLVKNPQPYLRTSKDARSWKKQRKRSQRIKHSLLGDHRECKN